MKIFVSYNKNDVKTIQPIVDALHKKGLDIRFCRERIDLDEDFAEAHITALNDSDCILFFHSENVNNSQWNIREIQHAIKLEKRIVVVKLDSAPLGNLEYDLSSRTILQREESDDDRKNNEFISSLQSSLVTDQPGSPHETGSSKHSVHKKPFGNSTRIYNITIAIITGLMAIAVYFTFFYKKTVTPNRDSVVVRGTDQPDDAVVRGKNGNDSAIIITAIGTFVATSMLFVAVAHIRRRNSKTNQLGHVIKIFIAGSTTLERERDALRSVISIMYNKWQSHDFKILSYTFEDFPNTFMKDGGPQKEYERFIEEEADEVVFIIDGSIGGITLGELDVALKAFEKNKKRPKILALSRRDSEDTDEISAIRKLINDEGQYWTSYTTILELKKEFESALNWDLIEMIKTK